MNLVFHISEDGSEIELKHGASSKTSVMHTKLLLQTFNKCDASCSNKGISTWATCRKDEDNAAYKKVRRKKHIYLPYREGDSTLALSCTFKASKYISA